MPAALRASPFSCSIWAHMRCSILLPSMQVTRSAPALALSSAGSAHPRPATSTCAPVHGTWLSAPDLL